MAGRSSFARRWFVAVTLGETSGFAAAAAFAVVAVRLGLEGAPRLALAIVGGAAEGALLAVGQRAAMSSNRPPAARWVGATAAAAAFAWLLGMLPSTLALRLGSPLSVVLLGLGALALLASIPVAQWFALGRRPGTSRWVPANIGAWLVAVLWTAAPSPLVDEHSATSVIVVLYVMAGLLMAVTVAVLTVPVARRLFGPPAAVRVGPTQPATGASIDGRGRSARRSRRS